MIQQLSLIDERYERISFLPKRPESKRETERPIVESADNKEDEGSGSCVKGTNRMLVGVLRVTAKFRIPLLLIKAPTQQIFRP